METKDESEDDDTKEEDEAGEIQTKQDEFSQEDSEDKEQALKEEADVRDIRYNLETLLWNFNLTLGGFVEAIWYDSMFLLTGIQRPFYDHTMFSPAAISLLSGRTWAWRADPCWCGRSHGSSTKNLC